VSPTAWDWIEWARAAIGRYGLNSREGLLLLYFATRARPGGTCWPSEERIKADLGWSNDTLAKAKKGVRAKGLLSWDPNGYKKTRGRPGCLYTLHPNPAVLLTAPAVDTEPTTRAEAASTTRAEAASTTRPVTGRTTRAEAEPQGRAREELQGERPARASCAGVAPDPGWPELVADLRSRTDRHSGADERQAPRGAA
jgi:hypothetical protein